MPVVVLVLELPVLAVMLVVDLIVLPAVLANEPSMAGAVLGAQVAMELVVISAVALVAPPGWEKPKADPAFCESPQRMRPSPAGNDPIGAQVERAADSSRFNPMKSPACEIDPARGSTVPGGAGPPTRSAIRPPAGTRQDRADGAITEDCGAGGRRGSPLRSTARGIPR
jgi:hypothetical protein